MLDITRVLFIPAEAAQQEASKRKVIKKLVDRVFTKEDKRAQLRKRGFEGDELDKALADFAPERILPPGEINLVSSDSHSFVVESEALALSYTNGRGQEEPHWHPDEVETYLSTAPFRVALRSTDEPGPHRIVALPAGRLIIPARICHFVDLRGHTEVISLRQKSQMSRVNCLKCHLRENESCKGLRRAEDSYAGEQELVGLAEQRSRWIRPVA
jgi:hypothetical protein